MAMRRSQNAKWQAGKKRTKNKNRLLFTQILSVTYFISAGTLQINKLITSYDFKYNLSQKHFVKF